MITFSQFLAENTALVLLQSHLQTTDVPRRTRFLMPDGTRLTFLGTETHDRAARSADTSLIDVMRAGAVRYVSYVGIETMNPLTREQARVLADDWAGYDGDSIVVDIVDRQSMQVITSKEFSDVSAETLYQFTRAHAKS